MEILTKAVPAIPSQAWPFIIIWTVAIKGIALWRSARCNQKHWFIVMLILNLFGIVELVYLLFFSGGFLSELLGGIRMSKNSVPEQEESESVKKPTNTTAKKSVRKRMR